MGKQVFPDGPPPQIAESALIVNVALANYYQNIRKTQGPNGKAG